MAHVDKVPETFGKLGRTSGLYFGCKGCARGKLFTAVELVTKYGAEGRVRDLAKRLACKFCKEHRRRAPPVYVEVSRPFYSKAEQARFTMCDVDGLVFDIRNLRAPRTISSHRLHSLGDKDD